MTELTHVDRDGNARMVDVGAKPVTTRVAIAKGVIKMEPATLSLIQAGDIKKGNVLNTAQIAGVMAAKRAADLIPLCHPLPLDQVKVELHPDPSLPGIVITATVRTNARTGVEMEALTAVSIAALTVYDMAKGVEKTMQLTNIRLVSKTGGQSGDVYTETET